MNSWAGRRIKAAVAALCAFFVLCGGVAGFTARAEDGYTAEATYVYTHTLSDRAPVGADPADIVVSSVLVDFDRYEFDHPGSAHGSKSVDVVWELDGIDTSATGVVEIPGRLQAPDWLYMPMGNAVTFSLTLVETLTVSYGYSSAVPQLLEVGGNAAGLALPATGTIACLPRPMVIREVPLIWDYGSIDPNTPGRQMLRGEYLLPGGYVYSDAATGGRLYEEVAVLVYDPAAPPLYQVVYMTSPYKSDPVLVPQNATQQQVEAALAAAVDKRISIELDTGDAFNFEDVIRCSSAGIDTAAIGWQQGCSLDIPPCFDIPEAFLALRDIYVIDPAVVDIGAARLDIWMGSIAARWLAVAEDAEVWVQIDKGEWQPCAEIDRYFGRIDYSGTTLTIDYEHLEVGRYYLFQVRYGAGKAQRSTLLEVYWENGNIRFEGTGGDRDGGDRDEDDPPEIEQPVPPVKPGADSSSKPQSNSQASGGSSSSAPAGSSQPVDSSSQPVDSSSSAHSTQSESEPAQQPQAPMGAGGSSESGDFLLEDEPPPGGDMDGGDRDEDDATDITQPAAGQAPASGSAHGSVAAAGSAAASAPAYEVVNATTTSLSGLRLRELATLRPQGVLFQKGGLSLWLDADFLLALTLADDALFTVIQTVHDDGSFTIEVLADGVAIEEMPGTRLQLAWAAGQPLACTSDDSYEAADLACDADTGLLSMTIDHTGHYTVAVEAPPQSAAGGNAPAGGGTLPAPGESAGGGWPLLGTLGIVLVAGAGGGTGIVLAKRRRQR
ncbi:MAG: hypothetical protein GXY32_02250 [Ruminococcaceae bacterium]|nr:hypothetical protein [Oscillospiraceae bacterium]